MNTAAQPKPAQPNPSPQPPARNVAVLKQKIEKMAPRFQVALPKTIPVERFMGVVQTAINSDPKLQDVDETSLFAACVLAAQDGLLPDKRDGALVPYNSYNKEKKQWLKMVRWNPMVGGILKKIRNSGEVEDFNAYVVYSKDEFYYQLGDEPLIRHVPYIGDDRGSFKAVYAIAKMKEGGIYREVMSKADVDKVKDASKAESGAWFEWYDEMARKSVIRRLSKRLPMSTDDVFHMFQREEQYEKEAALSVPTPPKPPSTLVAQPAAPALTVVHQEPAPVIANETVPEYEEVLSAPVPATPAAPPPPASKAKQPPTPAVLAVIDAVAYQKFQDLFANARDLDGLYEAKDDNETEIASLDEATRTEVLKAFDERLAALETATQAA